MKIDSKAPVGPKLKCHPFFDRLPAYRASPTTRLLKSPKAFFNDPALAVFLSGYFELDDLRKAREYGSYFETFIYHHLRILTRLMTPSARLYFWRTLEGNEVDFVLEYGRRLLAIEVRLTDTLGYRDTAGLRLFFEKNIQRHLGFDRIWRKRDQAPG